MAITSDLQSFGFDCEEVLQNTKDNLVIKAPQSFYRITWLSYRDSANRFSCCNKSQVLCLFYYVFWSNSPKPSWFHRPLGRGRAWFCMLNLNPTHAQMKLHVLACCFRSPVPHRLQTCTSPQPRNWGPLF